MDITEPLPNCEGYTYLLTSADRFFSWCKNRSNGEYHISHDNEHSPFRVDSVFLVFQHSSLQTGDQFESAPFCQLMRLLDCKQIHSTQKLMVLVAGFHSFYFTYQFKPIKLDRTSALGHFRNSHCCKKINSGYECCTVQLFVYHENIL